MPEPLRLVSHPAVDPDPHERVRQRLSPRFRDGGVRIQPDDVALWGRRCAVDECAGWDAHGAPALCAQHRKRLHYARSSLTLSAGPGSGDDLTREAFAADASVNGGGVGNDHPGFSFAGLPPALETELRLLVQLRSEQRRTLLRVHEFNHIKKVALAARLTSLLPAEASRTDDRWMPNADLPEAFRDDSGQSKAHLRFAISAFRDLAWPVPIEERDRWHQHDFGFEDQRVKTISWVGYRQQWFKRWAQKWVAYRLNAGSSWATGGSYAGRLLTFSRFLDEKHPHIASPADLTRDHLLQYAGWVRQPGIAESQQQGLVSAVRVLIEDHRLNQWAPALPETTVLRHGELPRRGEALPRPIDEYLLRRLFDPENLRRARPDLRVMLEVLHAHGFRIGTLVKLAIDCLGEDAEGFPTLRYWNTKRKRERLHPIREPHVVELIKEQRARALTRHPHTAWLFPAIHGNVLGDHHLTESAVRVAFYDYQDAIELKDSAGKRARVTLHQFRHTFGTRELNNGAPQEVVQELLDHDDPKSTRGYSRLTNKRLRDQFLAAARFDADGQFLDALLPESPLADVAWMRERLNRARVTLSNGYCGLPLQQDCEAQNACLDCKPYFVTTPEFLPAHEAHRQRTAEMVEAAEAAGHTRMVEKNRTVLVKLDTLIASLRSAS